MAILVVGAGGFLGAIARYLVDGWVSTATGGRFPWGTFVVNMTGSFLLGILFAATVERALLPASIRAPILTGFIGAYTTFSTLTLETWRLVEDGSSVAAFGNLAGSAVIGMIALVAGLALGRAL